MPHETRQPEVIACEATCPPPPPTPAKILPTTAVTRYTQPGDLVANPM
jgi:hypothetical protein